MENGKEYKVTWNPVEEKGYPSFDAVNRDDPEPTRYYDWMLWKMRQEDKMKEHGTVTVTKTVHIQEFPTYVLIGELYNRIYDSIHDEEPRSDRFLDTITTDQKETILSTLTKVVDDIHP